MEPYSNMGAGYYSPRSSPNRFGVKDSLALSSGVFPDEDSGFNSSFSLSRLPQSEDFSLSPRSPMVSPGAIVRSKSLSRLSGSLPVVTQEVTPFTHNPFRMDRSLRNLKGNLEDSENRRHVLVHKLREAQSTLELQSERLSKIENAAKGNAFLLDDLKHKEREYRKSIDSLQLSEQEKDVLKMENIKLRQEMQDRIDKLDFALRSLQAQHQVAEKENQKRVILLDQSAQALNMLETENNKLKLDQDSMTKEMAIAREAIELARSKFEPMEEENRDLRSENATLKEQNADFTRKISELTGQLMELRKLTQSMKDENEKLASSWKSLSEERQRLVKQVEGSQEKAAEMKTKAEAVSAEKDRLFKDKMDLNNKFQQLMLNKDELSQMKMAQEEQIHDLETDLERMKKNLKKNEEDKLVLQEEASDLRRVSDGLSAELNSVRNYYEKALEQINELETEKRAHQQQGDIRNQEQNRLKGEIERLNKQLMSKTKEIKKGREEMDELISKLKDDLRSHKDDNFLLENKVEELTAKLNKANDNMKYAATTSQEELDTWKDTCERLTASVSRKEAEVQSLSEKCLELEDLTAKLQSENRLLKEDNEALTEQVEDINKLKDENRKMIQEKAENEQMIKLLETQKEVLTKSSESQLAKLHDIEQLTARVDQLRNENEHHRARVLELENVRDNLVKQKEELLANTELIYKNPKLEELQNRVDELQEANRQLRDINDSANERCQTLEEANRELKEAVGGDGSVVPKYDLLRVQEERDRLEDDIDHIRQQYNELQEKHQKYTNKYGPDGEAQEQVRLLEREKEGLEKQVALINGQLLLVESSKKRLDEVVEDLQHEIVHLRKELEEAEKQPVTGPDMSELQAELEELRSELTLSQKDKIKQEHMVRSLKEELEEERTKKPTQIRESLDDVGTELTSMRGELHKLVGEIERKEQTIATLENQLRQSKEKIEDKDKKILDLKSGNGHSTTHSLEDTQPKSRLDSLRKSDSVGRTQSLTEKGSGDRLQSLISKYRNYGEQSSPHPERKIKPLPLISSSGSKMGLVTRGKSFGPAAPKSEDKTKKST
ncbi:CAP-Gly domain-containing linker protein 1-like [Saccostrea cucullata]|uniref:CAP-Gly domain-containing linker protein 1-like n=1 Tax=Saccostrea cuccullata TaxID=36930 RepID=UPI002ED4F737